MRSSFSSDYVERVLPIFRRIKSSGRSVYIKTLRNHGDGQVPMSVWIPGLDVETSRKLYDALSYFDSDDHESITTTLITSELVTSEGWVEI